MWSPKRMISSFNMHLNRELLVIRFLNLETGKYRGPVKLYKRTSGWNLEWSLGVKWTSSTLTFQFFFPFEKSNFFWGSACHVRQGPSIQRLLLAHFGSPHELLVRMVEVKKKKNQKKRRKYEYTANWSKSLGARFTHNHEPRAATMKWWEPKRKCT